MSFTHQLLLLGFIVTVNGSFHHCRLVWEMQQARGECETQLRLQTPASTGCLGEWNSGSCWHNATVGEVLTLPCPTPFLQLFGTNGNLSRNCTKEGWSSVYPNISIACTVNFQEKSRVLAVNLSLQVNLRMPPLDLVESLTRQLVFYKVVHILSTLGHSLSLITLLTSTVIICSFRRLHCMRNYIHLNLFVSFMLRAVAVVIKDALLFSEDEIDCSTQPSLVGCKVSMVFMNYFVMANYFWLLVEGLYLHMLLLVNHTYSNRLSIYMLIGWGIPFIFVVAWVICRINLADTGCWEISDNPIALKLITWPVVASVIISFILFINIVRILVQKLHCSNVGGNHQSQHGRLVKSTLLLIPLFGVNYVVFCYYSPSNDDTLMRIRFFFDLGLGSFQGLIVAVLYCFLNSEVQGELRRTWGSFSLKRFMGQDYRLRAMSANRNGIENPTQFPRNMRAQSILQTETSML